MGFLHFLLLGLQLVSFIRGDNEIGNNNHKIIAREHDETDLDRSTTKDDPDEIRIPVVFDFDTCPWARDLIDYVFHLIATEEQQRSDERIEFAHSLYNSKCDEFTAAEVYQTLRKKHGDIPPHAMVAARCSGATEGVALTSLVDQVPVISAIARALGLIKYDMLTQIMAPDGPEGEVGAMVAMLRRLQSSSVSILATETEYSRAWVKSFESLWKGEHHDASGKWHGQVDTQRLQLIDNKLDMDSVKDVLNNLSEANNKRIVILVAHSQHAEQFFEKVVPSNRNQDIVWLGSSAWIGRFPEYHEASYLPNDQGFLGVSPFLQHQPAGQQNQSKTREFLNGLKTWQANHQKDVWEWEDLPVLAAEIVDSIEAMVRAIRATPKDQRRDGALVTENLHEVRFEGLTGTVAFTAEGYRANPSFSVINLQKRDGKWVWELIGETQTMVNSTNLYTESTICLPRQGCELSANEFPKYTHPSGQVAEEPGKVEEEPGKVAEDRPADWALGLGVGLGAGFVTGAVAVVYAKRRQDAEGGGTAVGGSDGNGGNGSLELEDSSDDNRSGEVGDLQVGADTTAAGQSENEPPYQEFLFRRL